MTAPLPLAVGSVEPAGAAGVFGLYPATNFRITTGTEGDGPTIRQALWYFRAETIALPKPHLPWRRSRPASDLRRRPSVGGNAGAGRAARLPTARLVAAPAIIRHARISADGAPLVTNDGLVPYELTPKIPLNRSYFDASSIAFLSSRAVAVRGTPEPTGFVVRTFWPEDFTLGPQSPPVRALPTGETPGASLRALMREAPHGGAQSPYSAVTLCSATPQMPIGSETYPRADGQRRARRRRRGAWRSLRSSPDVSPKTVALATVCQQLYTLDAESERASSPRRCRSTTISPT